MVTPLPSERPELREFYLCAIKKVASYLCAIEKFGHTYVPSTQTFVSSMPFRPCSIQFLPCGSSDMWDWEDEMSILPLKSL
jgi:hypothetical protein